MVTNNTPAYLHALGVRINASSGSRERHVLVSFRIEPFERDHAEALDPTIAAQLFDSDAPIQSIRFGLSPQPANQLRLATAPDAQPSVSVEDAQLLKTLRVRHDLETGNYSAVIQVLFPTYTARMLHTLVSGVGELWYVSVAGVNLELPMEPDSDETSIVATPSATKKAKRGRK